jgi:phage tail-like protein
MMDRTPHFLLDSIAGWRAANLDHAAVTRNRLELQLVPGSPVPLVDTAGTFGGLQNPIGIALDSHGRIYVLDSTACSLLRYDRCLHQFLQLPCIGPCGCQPRQLDRPHGLAISCSDDIYIADTGNRRVQVFSAQGLSLRRVFGPLQVVVTGDRVTVKSAIPNSVASPQSTCNCAALYPPGTWEPWDVAITSRGWAYVSDHANGLIHVFDPRGCWRAAYNGQGEHTPPLSKPTRLALDTEGNLYVLQDGSDSIVILASDGTLLGTIDKPDQITGQFCPIAVAIDAQGQLCISDCISRKCYSYTQSSNDPYQCACQSINCGFATALVFDSSGQAIFSNGTQLLCQLPASSYEISGMFISSALDSKTYRCVWHRVALTGCIPPGAAVRVDVFTSESLKTDDEIASLAPSRWAIGQIDTDSSTDEWDCLIQAPPGRYLWLRLTLTGDSSVTPSLARVRVYFPRASSLQYLPAVYRADATSSDFLDRFLSIFDSLRSPISGQISDMAALFDPMATPAGNCGSADFLSWLATWLGLSLQGNWPISKRRQLVRQAHLLFKLRGTPQGLRLHIQLYAGVEPRILELFRLRRWTIIDSSTLGNNSILFGNSIMNRLQIGVNSDIGSFQLIDYGDPSLDAFNKYAHRFLVVVPQWPGAGQPEQLALQQIIDMAKPAHTLAEFQWAEPKLRIGLQSFIGVDTVIAGYPSGIVEGQGKLGYDTVVSGSPVQGHASMQVGRRSVIGCNTSLQ